MAVLKKDKNIVTYLLPLSLMGGIVSLYHSLTHFGLGDGVLECTSALGDCGKLYVFEYGYITIPFMAFTIFAYLLLVSLIFLRSNKK
jgi:disulfide bond formation protein DsbB